MPASPEVSPLGHPQGTMVGGVWNRSIPRTFALKLAISYALADAAVLLTVPAGKRLYLDRVFWEIITGFTGGSSSAIGISSSGTGYTTKGDLLGGASGDVAATLVAGVKGGTIGADFGSNGIILLEPGATIRFDRITSAFTAGDGFVHVLGSVVD